MQPGADPDGTPPPSLIYVVGRVDRGIRRELQRRLASLELSVPEFTCLSVLGRRPGLSNAQLARRSLITPQSMIQVTSGLEQRQLVQRTVDPSHGRVRLTRLTAEGERLLLLASTHVETLQEELFDGVSPDARQALLETLLTAMRRLSGESLSRSDTR